MIDNSFNVQSKLVRELVMTPYRQAAWGTPIAAADLTRIQRFDGSAVIDFGTERRSDKQMSGKGFSFATNSQPTMRSIKLTGIKAEATDWNVAAVLANLMGSVVSVGLAAPYTHTISFDETTRSAIPTTIYMRDTEDVAFTLADMFCTSATLTIPAKGAVSLEWDMLGTGVRTPGVLAAAPVVPNENYLMGSDAVLNWGPVGAAVSKLGRHMSTTIKVDNQGMVHEAPGGGLFGIFGRRQDPKFSVSSVITATNIDDVLTHYINDDKVTYSLPILSGPNCGLTVNIPACNLKTTKMGFDGDMPIWNVETDETTSYDVAGVQPISFTILSGTPAFGIVAP